MNAFKENITSADFWLRVLYTLLFALAWQVIEFLLAVILVLQLCFRLFTGEPHARLAGFGNSLSQYAWQSGRYVSGASELKPWPFMEWPAEDAEWQPRPAAEPVIVVPESVVMAAGAAHEPVDAIIEPDVEPITDPVIEPLIEPETREPEPPLVHPTDFEDTDENPGDGSRLKP